MHVLTGMWELREVLASTFLDCFGIVRLQLACVSLLLLRLRRIGISRI